MMTGKMPADNQTAPSQLSDDQRARLVSQVIVSPRASSLTLPLPVHTQPPGKTMKELRGKRMRASFPKREIKVTAASLSSREAVCWVVPGPRI